MNPASRVVIIVFAIAAVGGALLWWRHRPAPPPPPSSIARLVTPAPAASVPAPPVPAIRYPVGPTVSPRGALPALDDSDAYLKNALVDLLGRRGVLSFLAVDGFARRLVATVNNLATDNAASEMWPVNRPAGLFDTEARAGGSVISTKNADRYAAFVRFVEGIETQRAVGLYLRLYPLFQHAYEDLGFPGKYFNDRVVEVIDNLLATPDLAEPLKVKLVEIDGSIKPRGPGGLYLFEDSTLEASSSGQKILLRVGRENAAKLKAKLTDIRQQITKAGAVRTPSDK